MTEPVVTPTNSLQLVVAGGNISLGASFSISGVSAAEITSYNFWDGGIGGGSLLVNGEVQAAQTTISISPATLSLTGYLAGPNRGSELLWVQASTDGVNWSPWVSFTAQTVPVSNTLPQVIAPLTKNVEQNQYARLSDFLGVADADGDPIVSFEIKDDNAA